MNTPSPSSCPQCGNPIPDGSPQGLCPRCLMLGVAEPTQVLPTMAHLPTREEIAQAFPALEVGEMIGHGGMGAVFKVRQPKLERDVALKVLPRSLAADPAFAERFHREARALAKLNHPNIVTVHDFGQQGGWYFLLMEYVDGVNLRQAMRTKRFTPEQALEIVPRVCEALQYAHSEGVLHRDIKPENLLLDSRGRVKIADFGIAKLGQTGGEELSLTLSGARLGTMAYMAPEQIEHPGEVDHRADIYSLGVVFYEMLTGELPIGRFAAPSEKSAVNALVDQVVFRTLEKERERRFQSAGEMQTQVETLAGQTAPDHTPPLPPVPSTPARPAGRFSGPGMAIALLIFGALASAGSMFTVRSVQMSEHRRIDSSMTEMPQNNPNFAPPRPSTVEAVRQTPGLPWIAVCIVMGVLPLIGTILGWKNVLRLRHAYPPRSGIVAASIAALLPLFIPLWMIIAINVENETLAWMDAIAITAILLIWFCCWMNPHPRPWSAKAVLAITLIFVPLLFIAHGWGDYNRRLEGRWAQEMNNSQQRINEAQHRVEIGDSAKKAEWYDLQARMERLQLSGQPTFRLSMTSEDRALLALSLLFAVLGTVLGWMARADMLKEPGTQRGLGMAKFAAYFWPVGIVPLGLLLLA